MNRTVRRVVTATLTGALTVTTLPVLAAGGAQAATTTLTPAQATAALRSAVATSAAAYSTLGGRSTTNGELRLGGAAAGTFSGEFTADAQRRHTKRALRLDSVAYEQALEGTSYGPCRPESLAYDYGNEIDIVAERKARFTYLGAPTNRTLRAARKLLKEPRARWESRPTRATVASAARIGDLALDQAMGVEASAITAATRADLAGVTRYTVDYGDSFGTNRLVLDVNSAGRIVASTGSASWDGWIQTARTTSSYGPQSVALPAASAVVRYAKLSDGCRAVRTKQTVLQTAREVRVRLNARARATDRAVTVGRVRGRVDTLLPRLKVRAEDVARGSAIVGRHPLLTKPVVRRVLVVKGKVVVRRGF
jgi:hypothetical protein